MENAERINKAKGCIMEMYWLTKDSAVKIDLSALCKKHGISTHVAKATVNLDYLRKVKKGYYKWRGIVTPNDADVEAVLKECTNIQRGYELKYKRKRKYAMKKEYREKNRGMVGSTEAISRTPMEQYFETDFELIRCYISLGEAEKALPALDKLKGKVNKIAKKL